MSFFDKFRKKEERAENTFSVTASAAPTGDRNNAADVMYAKLFGRAASSDMAMEIPSVNRCVNMIAGAVAMLPIKMYKKDNGKVREITDDPRLEMLNGKTGDTLNADEMRYAWVRDYLLGGNAYAYIERKFGMPVGLKYIAQKNVSINYNAADVIYKRYDYNVNGRILMPYEMVKFLRNTDGFGKGRGIIEENPLIIETAYNMVKFQRNQLIKGGNKKGFIKAEKTLGKDAMSEIRNAWSRLYSNDNEERVVFLNNGIDFKEVSNTAVEMQINQNSITINSEIMKLFGTTDGLLSEATVKNAVMPVLDVFEAAFDADLLMENERKDTYFAFDTRELTRGDINTRYQAYATALSQNFMQLDEVRAQEDLPPLGVNFIKLGLQDVLYDPKTKTIYTPNTNQTAAMGGGGIAMQNDTGEKQLTDDSESGIIEDDKRANDYYIKLSNGKLNGSRKRKATPIDKLSSSFVTDHPNAEIGKSYPYELDGAFYIIHVNGYSDYTVENKIPITEKNRSKIKLIREMFKDD